MYKETAKQNRCCMNHTQSCPCPLNSLQQLLHEIKAAQVEFPKTTFHYFTYSRLID